MEGTQPHEIRAALFELHMPPHHIDHICACNELLNKTLWNGHGAMIYGAQAR